MRDNKKTVNFIWYSKSNHAITRHSPGDVMVYAKHDKSRENRINRRHSTKSLPLVVMWLTASDAITAAAAAAAAASSSISVI